MARQAAVAAEKKKRALRFLLSFFHFCLLRLFAALRFCRAFQIHNYKNPRALSANPLIHGSVRHGFVITRL
jgi:hypothetical protein